MRFFSVLVLASAVLLSGCSTLFMGTNDDVTIHSDPVAEAEVDGRAYQTPREIALDRDDPHIVRVNKEGYEEHAVTLESGLNWGGLFLDAGVGGLIALSSNGHDGWIATGTVVGLLGIGIDFLTGAAYRVKPDDLDIQLQQKLAPESTPPSPSESIAETPTPSPPTYQSVVDTQIPKTTMDRPNAIAVVVGNKTYRDDDIPNVDYALRDAEIVKRYLTRTLGFREENIIYEENATGSVLTRIFGTQSEPKGQLHNWVKDDKSDVFVYYSGHGAPSPESEDAFLVATDTDPNYLTLNGYPVDQLYENLAQLPAASVTVVLESCFSGVSEAGSVVQEVSPAVLSVENPMVGMENGLAITAGAADQVSSWYSEKKHGLFTYYFLKGLRGAADKNEDAAVTAREIDAYLTEEVPYQAARQHNRKQTPQVMGQDEDRVLVRYDNSVPAEPK